MVLEAGLTEYRIYYSQLEQKSFVVWIVCFLGEVEILVEKSEVIEGKAR